jgi:hypothetical protein
MNVRLQYPIKFSASIWYDGQLRINTYNVRLWLLTNTISPNDHNIAIDRIKYFVHGRLDSSIFISDEHRDQIQALHASGVRVTSFPGEPIDQMIGIMLYCKLTSIMEGRLLLGEVEISSELSEGIVYMHNEEEILGPYEDEGWWHNPDLTQCDTELLGDEKVMSLAKSIIWRELGLNWADVESTEDTGNTIIFTDFNRNETK